MDLTAGARAAVVDCALLNGGCAAGYTLASAQQAAAGSIRAGATLADLTVGLPASIDAG